MKVIRRLRSEMGMVPYVTRSLVKKMTVRMVLPSLLMLLGWISFFVYVAWSRDGNHFTYSHSSYVAFGISLGLWTASVVSSVFFWLFKDNKQEANR